MRQSIAVSPFALSAMMLFSDHHHGSVGVMAFCPNAGHSSTHHHHVVGGPSSVLSSTNLFLLPGQGKQLEAAFNAASSRADSNGGSSKAPTGGGEQQQQQQQQQQEPSNSSSHWRALSSSRSFVTRLFHLPSNNIKHPHPVSEGLKDTNSDNRSSGAPTFPTFFVPQQQQQQKKSSSSSAEDNGVLYPVVGFTFCNTKNDGCIALPTTSNASCRLQTSAQRQEEVFGWYTPGCKLDLYSEDVCHKPFDLDVDNKNDDEVSTTTATTATMP
jgi:hypothetical protein